MEPSVLEYRKLTAIGYATYVNVEIIFHGIQ